MKLRHRFAVKESIFRHASTGKKSNRIREILSLSLAPLLISNLNNSYRNFSIRRSSHHPDEFPLLSKRSCKRQENDDRCTRTRRIKTRSSTCEGLMEDSRAALGDRSCQRMPISADTLPPFPVPGNNIANSCLPWDIILSGWRGDTAPRL